MRVFVVDDDPDMRFMVKRALSKHTVVEFEAAFLALQALQEGETCDAIFCDLRMPKMNGFEFLLLVKEQFPQILMIMMTCAPSLDWIIQAEDLGADHCLLEPQGSEDILNALNKAQRKAMMKG